MLGSEVVGPAGAHVGPDPYIALEKALVQALDRERLVLVATLNQQREGKPDIFGDPLDFRKAAFNVERHAFWPANEQRMPLLFFCARVFLGGQLTSTENERFHNVAGYVINKFRSSLSPENREYYTVAKYLLTRDLKEPEDALECADAADDLLEYPEVDVELK